MDKIDKLLIFLSSVFISLLLILFSTFETYKTISDILVTTISTTASVIALYDFFFLRKK